MHLTGRINGAVSHSPLAAAARRELQAFETLKTRRTPRIYTTWIGKKRPHLAH